MFLAYLLTLSPFAVAQLSSLPRTEVRLEPKFTVGEKYNTREVIHRRQTVGPHGSKPETTNVSVEWNTEVTEAGMGQGWKGTTKIHYLSAELKTSFGTAKFDSTNPDLEPDGPLDSLYRNYFLKLNEATLDWRLPDVGDSIAKATFGIDLIDNNYVMASFADFSALPRKRAVSVGDRWEGLEKLNIDNMRSLIIRRRFEYVGRVARSREMPAGPDVDEVTASDLSARYEDKGESNSITAKLKSSDINVKTGKHTFFFDRTVGRIIAQHGVLEINGSLKYEVRGKGVDWTLELLIDYDCKEVPRAATKGAE